MSSEAARSSAHLGATLRSVLIAPSAGVHAALRSADRKERVGDSPPEGYSPYVLGALGGAAALLLWLKLSVLMGLRTDSAATYRWGFLVGAGIVGALLGLAAQFLWGAVAARWTKSLDSGVKAREARLVWGASAFPQVFALVLLLPLDLLVVGSSSFTSARPGDPVASAWAALSIALSLALATWSVLIFVKGIEVISGSKSLRLAGGFVLAVLCLGIVVAGFRFGAIALAGALT
ncbi:MAG: hypothetical protein ACR2KQ_08605 [Actinomycetota bacterium]